MTDRHTSFWDKEKSILFLPRSRSDEGTHPSRLMLTNELFLFFAQQSTLKKQSFWGERTRKKKGFFFRWNRLGPENKTLEIAYAIGQSNRTKNSRNDQLAPEDARK